MKLVLVPLVAVLAVGFAVPATGAKKPKKYATTTTATYSGSPGSETIYQGRVSSKKAACKQGRKVTLYVFSPIAGDHVATSNSATTAADGSWSFSSTDPNRPGTSVVVKQKKIGKNLCQEGTAGVSAAR